MTEWHRRRRGDLGLRALGLATCALSYGSFQHLMAMHVADPAHWSPGLLAYVLTATGFLAASAGSAMVTLGTHLFDKIEVSERWRAGHLASERRNVLDFASLTLLSPGYHRPAGPWEARSTVGMTLGRQDVSNAGERIPRFEIKGEEEPRGPTMAGKRA